MKIAVGTRVFVARFHGRCKYESPRFSVHGGEATVKLLRGGEVIRAGAAVMSQETRPIPWSAGNLEKTLVINFAL